MIACRAALIAHSFSFTVSIFSCAARNPVGLACCFLLLLAAAFRFVSVCRHSVSQSEPVPSVSGGALGLVAVARNASFARLAAARLDRRVGARVLAVDALVDVAALLVAVAATVCKMLWKFFYFVQNDPSRNEFIRKI